MKTWKRFLATGMVASVALLGAACEVEDDDPDTAVVDEEGENGDTVVNEGDTEVEVTEEETVVEDGGTETEG